MNSNDFAGVIPFLDSAVPQMIELQRLLTSVPALAPENGGDGELDKCIALEKWLRANNITQLQRYDAPDSRAKEGIRPNLIAEIPGIDTSKNLWIMSHLDVVPVGEISLWSSDPWTVVEKDGRLYGRGVEDNQQGLVSSIFAALSLIKNNIKPACTVKLLFAADEECGSEYGIQYLINNFNLFNKDDLVIIPDGGDSLGRTIEVAEKNLLWMKITVKGKQTHGSRPDEGANACLAGCALALALNGLEKELTDRNSLFDPDRSTFQPTKKEANVPNINTIPGEDIFYMDCRILPSYPLDTVRARTAEKVSEIAEKYGVTVEISEEQAVESPATAPDAPVVRTIARAVKKVYGQDAVPIGIGGGTVGAYLRKAGCAAAVWSRLDETAHQPDEYCVISNMRGDAEVLARIMSGE